MNEVKCLWNSSTNQRTNDLIDLISQELVEKYPHDYASDENILRYIKTLTIEDIKEFIKKVE
jgi:hypothetical protein